MDLHSKMTMYVTSTMTSPVTKTAKMSKKNFSFFQCSSTYFHDKSKFHLQNWILDLHVYQLQMNFSFTQKLHNQCHFSSSVTYFVQAHVGYFSAKSERRC